MEQYIKLNNHIIKNFSSFRFTEDNRKDLSIYFRNHRKRPLVLVNGQNNFIFFAVNLIENTMALIEFKKNNKNGDVEFVEELIEYSIDRMDACFFEDGEVKKAFFESLEEIKYLEDMKTKTS